MLISCHAAPTPRTPLLAQRPTRPTFATLRSLGHFPSTSSRRAAGFHDMPRSSARCRPHILLSRLRRPDLELDTISHPGPVPNASSIAGWLGVRLSDGCLVGYYLLTASDGARPPLEPSAALPHTAAPLIPLLDSHFLTIPVRSLVPAQRPSRPLWRSGPLLAGLGRGRASVLVPHAGVSGACREPSERACTARTLSRSPVVARCALTTTLAQRS